MDYFKINTIIWFLFSTLEAEVAKTNTKQPVMHCSIIQKLTLIHLILLVELSHFLYILYAPGSW